jgi:phenylacetic acid degradation operon negative regulatory protein
LPYLDPGLPSTLLPATWSGATAADLFATLRHALADPAHEFARSLLDDPS